MAGVPKEFDVRAFLRRLGPSAELAGTRVVYYDGAGFVVLREGPPLCAPGLRTIVIKPHTGEETLRSGTAAAKRESRLYQELLGGAVNCSAAVVGWIVAWGSIGAAPITAGASTFVTALGWGAAVAASGQCANSFVRIASEAGDPGLNDWLDRQQWYIATAYALDTISVFGAAAATGTTIKMALALRKSTGKSMLQILKGLSRQERKHLAEELVRAENPGISNSKVKALVRAGVYPRRFRPQTVSDSVRRQLKDALGAALGFTGSATGGVVRKGGAYAVGLAESFEAY